MGDFIKTFELVPTFGDISIKSSELVYLIILLMYYYYFHKHFEFLGIKMYSVSF